MADQTHRGITWSDFPGNSDNIGKKMNFSLFRCGVHHFNAACEGLEGEALKARLLELSAVKRAQWSKWSRTKSVKRVAIVMEGSL